MCQKGHKACTGACQCRGGEDGRRAHRGRPCPLRANGAPAEADACAGKGRPRATGKRRDAARRAGARQEAGGGRQRDGREDGCRRSPCRQGPCGGPEVRGGAVAGRRRRGGKARRGRKGREEPCGTGHVRPRFPARRPAAERARKKPRSQSGASISIGPEVRRPGLIRLRRRGLQLRLRAGLLLPPRDGRKRPSPARWPRCWRAGARARDVRPGYGWGRP